jgi:murein endopeptidase
MIFIINIIILSALAGPIPKAHFNKGMLLNGKSLFQIFKNNKDFELLSPEGYQYGIEEMQKALNKIAQWTKVLEKAPLRIGDISLRKGGILARHITHQMGHSLLIN